MKNKVLNDLFDYGLKIYQYQNSFKFSLDSILLAEYVIINSKVKSILDLCSGNASIPLILSTKTTSLIDAIEIQKDIYDLGIESIKYNNLDNQIKLYNDDIKNHLNLLKDKKYDIITCNPPYFKVDNEDFINNDLSLSISRHEVKITLEDIFQIATRHLNTKGEFYLVHRANRLDEIINYAIKYKLPVKNMVLITTKKSDLPYIVLVKCVKDALLGIKIANEICIENLKTYQNLFKELK